eukprot:CAMPEP_0119343838 /NCGR_PEP_ID=MMETSP1333-20130426/106660_1 /TAXON_ID=418940 /ORGANISM="Scyphosphaera apsteinii, Strain RCC1455" /LENGTH=124 /DNA_ID=CAMNT_0007356253 /DNA_START=440 /DNA_END=815 /DNA_ORIENTATION=-
MLLMGTVDKAYIVVLRETTFCIPALPKEPIIGVGRVSAAGPAQHAVALRQNLQSSSTPARPAAAPPPVPLAAAAACTPPPSQPFAVKAAAGHLAPQPALGAVPADAGRPRALGHEIRGSIDVPL